MISWPEAQDIIRQKAPLMPPFSCCLDKALGFVLAEDIYAISDLPSFDNAAMDGYALKAQWLENAKAEATTSLKVKGEILAGHQGEYAPDYAVPIMTGAKVPSYFDAVIPIEQVKQVDGAIEIKGECKKGNHIRYRGSDVQKGDLLISKGIKLNAYHLALMGAQAIADVQVYQKPKVAIIITGDEVLFNHQESHSSKKDSNQAALSQPNIAQEAQIADANGPFLKAAINMVGGDLFGFYYMSDSPEEWKQRIAELKGKVDLIISTGAVSAGVKDFIPESILAEGGTIHFHKIYQRPGKPLLFGALSDGTSWFGLPGNPVAVQASFVFSVSNWFNQAMQTQLLSLDHAVFNSQFHKKKPFRQFLRGQCYSNEQGILTVDLDYGQASYQLKNWGQSNCWIIAKEGIEDLNVGDITQILRI